VLLCMRAHILLLLLCVRFVANASPGSQHKTVHRLANESSVDLTGSDRDTDKEGSLTDLNDVVRPRRSVAQSIRRRAMQSAKSGAELQEQPSNSCPGQTPRRSDTYKH
jgi:hypothetical protein